METKHWALLIGAALVAFAGYSIIYNFYGYFRIPTNNDPNAQDVFANLK